MKNVFIINGHTPYPFAKGRLNATLVDEASRHLRERGYEVRTSVVADGWEVEDEIANHQWADVVLMQFPINWMGSPWLFKKYMDEVYTAGMDGRLCAGDGRSGPEDDDLYGLGGRLEDTTYMFSLTFNAPMKSFESASAPFFEGKTVDDLLWPMHLNMRFFGATPLPTFSAHDVMKNANIERDLERFRAHLESVFPSPSNH